jgi:hypothetical protein
VLVLVECPSSLVLVADRPRTVTTTEREPPPTHREHKLPTGKLPMSKDLGVPPILGGARVPGVRRVSRSTRVGLGVYDLRSSSGGGTLGVSGSLVGSIRAAVYVD